MARSMLSIALLLVASASVAGVPLTLDAPPALLSPARGAAVSGLDSELAAALEADRPEGALRAAGFRLEGGRVQVAVLVEGERLGHISAWLIGLGAVEMTIVDTRIEAFVPMAAVTALEARPGVLWVGRPHYAELPEPAPPAAARGAKETVVSEALRVMNVEAWHNQGYTGEGVKVGIIDSQFGGWDELVGSELPEEGLVHYRRFGGQLRDDEVHGTACAELVHDVAPGAELYLALVATTNNVAGAVSWMHAEGVRVITMSLTWLSTGPGDGTGVISDIIADFRATADGVWLNSAGNYRSSHWQGPSTDLDGDGWVETADGEELILLSGNSSVDERIRVYMVWNDWEVADQDYSLHLFSLEGEEPLEVRSADRIQSGQSGHEPWEQLNFTVEVAGRYGLGIYRKDVDGLNDLEIISVERYLSDPVESGSITPPCDSPDAVGVAALSTSGGYTYRNFSSAGPSNGPGGSLTGGSVKPDIGSYDGVSTVSYGPRGYYGTSAASPHAAGAAALVLDAHPDWTGQQVRTFLEEAAIDKGLPGMDNDYGHGRLNLGPAPGQDCTFSLSQEQVSVAASGGLALIQVTTTADCFWTTERSVEWVEITPDGRTGPGPAGVAVVAYDQPSARQTTVVIAGLPVTVDQAAACTFAVGPAPGPFPAEGGTGSIEVTAADGCAWTAASDADWVTIDDGATGSGSGSVSFTVAVNPAADQRSATLTVADSELAIVQVGAEGWTSLVAGVAATAGAADTRWSTNLACLNRSAEEVEVSLVYRHDGGVASAQRTLAAGAILEFEDAARSLFGVEEDSAGAVELSGTTPLIVLARTFNTSARGTFGQSLPGVVGADALATGATAVLSQIKSTDDVRTNLGAINLGETMAVVEVRLFDAAGAALGSALRMNVDPGEWSQRNRVFEAAGAGACDLGYATVEVVTADGLVWAYASVVDNRSGDPTTVPMVVLTADQPLESRQLVAGVASTAGDAGTRWRTNLAVLNPTSGDAEVSLTYRHSSGSVTRTEVVGEGRIVEWRDVAAELFAVGDDSAGSVEVMADRPLVVTARTFNDTPDGTFGQFLPGIDGGAAVAAGDRAILAQIKSGEDFRTNVGVVNLGPTAATVEVRLHDELGQAKGSPVTLQVDPGAWLQRNRVFSVAGAGDCPVGYATVEVLTAGGLVWPYASVVDNHSGDPTTIAPVMED